MKALWVEGLITDGSLKTFLMRTGMTGLNVGLLMKLWAPDVKAPKPPKVHLLSKYDLRTLLAGEKIATPDAVTGLENLGYSTNEARNLVAIWRGVTETEIDRLQARIDALEAPEPPTLSRTEVKQLFDKGLMNLEKVYQSLRDKGYSYEDGILLTQLYTDTTEAQIKGIQPYTPPAVAARDLTVTEIKQLYEAGAPGFDTLGTLARMKGIGYSEADATLIIALWLSWYPPEEGA